MKLPIFQVDAFSSRLFGGNPAAVVPLGHWLPDRVMQQIAAENNLAETAFFVPDERLDFGLRWFTPTTEVDLCGHATLAAAWVLFNELGHLGDAVSFASAGGDLRVVREKDLLVLDFPTRPGRPVPVDERLYGGLGVTRVANCLLARDLVVVLDDADTVRTLRPDFAALAGLDCFAVCVTAPGDDCDFVARFFAPRQGIDEDPVTGSAYCTLAPFWSARLGRGTLSARQLSHRGGELECRVEGDRVHIAGHARCYLRGEILLEPQDKEATQQ